MVRERRLCDVELVEQVTCADLPVLGDKLDNLDSVLIAEGLEDFCCFGGFQPCSVLEIDAYLYIVPEGASRSSPKSPCPLFGQGIFPIPSPSQRQRSIHQENERWHFDERADHGCERLARCDSEHGSGNGDRQLEVVPRRGERDGGHAPVIGLRPVGEPRGDEEHDGEVENERDGDT